MKAENERGQFQTQARQQAATARLSETCCANKKFVKYGFQKLVHENQLSQMHQMYMPPSESSNLNEACAREDGGVFQFPHVIWAPMVYGIWNSDRHGEHEKWLKLARGMLAAVVAEWNRAC